MLEAAAILARLDVIQRQLDELRVKLMESMPAPAAEGNGIDEPDAMIDTTSAAARFSLARDTIAKMCREVDGIGVWKGGRWQVRVGAMRRHLDRKNN
jgi:hypothetical protein